MLTDRIIYDSETGAYESISAKKKIVSFTGAFVTLLLLTAFLVAYLGINKQAANDSSSTSTTTIIKDSYGYEISYTFGRKGYPALPYFTNTDDNHANYKFLSGFIAVIEPSSPMLFVLSQDDAYHGPETGAVKILYKVCQDRSLEQTNGVSDCQRGTYYKSATGQVSSSEVSFSCSAYDQFTVDVSHVDSADENNVIRSATGKALCLQVRREIRTLTATDLANFVDVTHVLWNTSDLDGKQRYGSAYNSASYLLKLHHFNAGQLDADHIHEGNGFLLQHVKMTNIFESSLQSIDPSVALPYWDYTIDESQDKSLYQSFIMTEKVFGGMSLPSNVDSGFQYGADKIEQGRILNGMWASLATEINLDYPDLAAGYGYMRAPWSMNPSPFISRFTSTFNNTVPLPSCQTHYDVITGYNSMMDFFHEISMIPHSPIHTLAGGIYGCDQLLPLFEKGYLKSLEAVGDLCKTWVFQLKEYYRKHMIVPRSGCKANKHDLRESSCGFDCVENTIEDLKNSFPAVLGSFADLTKANATETWLEFICYGGPGGKIFPGDHLESASPVDPSFWVVHPTIERLFHYKLLAGGFENEQWYTDPKSESVCEKSQCYNSSFGFTDYWSHCCYGHMENDQMLDFESGNRNSYKGLTNAEVLSAGDPRRVGYSMPYIYDQFSWGHCKQDFAGLTAKD